MRNEPSPNRTCKDCGTDFYDPKSRLKFCDDCDSKAGANNGNWKNAKENTQCEHCGGTFEYYPSNKDGVYCPDCVSEADGLLPEETNEMIERIVTNCRYCQAEIRVLPSRAEKQKRGFFCDLSCYGAWLSENIVGERHHQWEGGQIPYGELWWEIRRQALNRDDYTCQHCLKTADELGKNPDVHHIRPVREFADPERAHSMSNVISLCRSCHQKVEAGNISCPTL